MPLIDGVPAGSYTAAGYALEGSVNLLSYGDGRGLHWFAFQLNLSVFCGTEGGRRGCVTHVKGVFRVCRVVLCFRHGSS
jgi:hypothetical protein